MGSTKPSPGARKTVTSTNESTKSRTDRGAKPSQSRWMSAAGPSGLTDRPVGLPTGWFTGRPVSRPASRPSGQTTGLLARKPSCQRPRRPAGWRNNRLAGRLAGRTGWPAGWAGRPGGLASGRAGWPSGQTGSWLLGQLSRGPRDGFAPRFAWHLVDFLSI